MCCCRCQTPDFSARKCRWSAGSCGDAGRGLLRSQRAIPVRAQLLRLLSYNLFGCLNVVLISDLFWQSVPKFTLLQCFTSGGTVLWRHKSRIAFCGHVAFFFLIQHEIQCPVMAQFTLQFMELNNFFLHLSCLRNTYEFAVRAYIKNCRATSKFCISELVLQVWTEKDASGHLITSTVNTTCKVWRI